jgi:hypothetical protein
MLLLLYMVLLVFTPTFLLLLAHAVAGVHAIADVTVHAYDLFLASLQLLMCLLLPVLDNAGFSAVASCLAITVISAIVCILLLASLIVSGVFTAGADVLVLVSLLWLTSIPAANDFPPAYDVLV